jgi:hypothetical protein
MKEVNREEKKRMIEALVMVTDGLNKLRAEGPKAKSSDETYQEAIEAMEDRQLESFKEVIQHAGVGPWKLGKRVIRIVISLVEPDIEIEEI